MYLDDILDGIVDDFQKEYPDINEFEAAFNAIQMNLAIVVQAMSMIGMQDRGLTVEELYHFCSRLFETTQWMAAKSAVGHALRGMTTDEN